MAKPPYPASMHHPNFQPAVLCDRNKGQTTIPRGAMFPPVTVHNAAQEEYHRAKGYLFSGESPPPKVYSPYPVLLYKTHPRVKVKTPAAETHFLALGYSRETPKTYALELAGPKGKCYETAHSAAQRDQLIKFGFTLKDTPIMSDYEEYPLWMTKEKETKLARDEDHEGELVALGFARPAQADPEAFQRAKAMPDGDYDPSEYPKYINGLLVQDPAKPATDFQEYPKWVGKVLVKSKHEEKALLGTQNITVIPLEEETPAPELPPLEVKKPAPGANVSKRA